jgi:hypothetical protein
MKQIEVVVMPSALAYSAVSRQSDTALGRWLGRWYFIAMMPTQQRGGARLRSATAKE